MLSRALRTFSLELRSSTASQPFMKWYIREEILQEAEWIKRELAKGHVVKDGVDLKARLKEIEAALAAAESEE